MNADNDSPAGVASWSYFYDIAENLRLVSFDDWKSLVIEIEYARSPQRRFVALESISARIFRQKIILRSGRGFVVEYELSRDDRLEPVMGGLTRE